MTLSSLRAPVHPELIDFVNPVARLLERDAAAQRSAVPSASLANLYRAPVPAVGESFDALAQFGSTTIERIVSSAEPATDPYLQEQDEWVVLLQGSAQLEIAGRVHALGPGDHVALPAQTPHRVLSASPGAVWLAVHVRQQKPSR